MPEKVIRRFRVIGIATVVAVYVLILIGGIVRSTGSGMGCPDWPKCFGSWVPPTDVSQLPADYKEVYTAQRVKKNQRLARTLEKLGFSQVAGDVFAHRTQYIETDFNPIKTWIEYLNRLAGAIIGLLMILTVWFARAYWHTDRAVFHLALLSFLLTLVQGWLGSLVVSTNLLPVMVTVHMGLALLIVALLLYAVDRARWERAGAVVAAVPLGAGWLKLGLWLALLTTFGQIVLGTQVREQIDMIAVANNYLGRDSWISQLGSQFYIHRSFSIVLLLLNFSIGYALWHAGWRQLAGSLVCIVAAEVVAGIMLAYLALPPAVQPVHLLLATGLFGVQFLALLAVARGVQSRPVGSPSPVVVA